MKLVDLLSTGRHLARHFNADRLPNGIEQPFALATIFDIFDFVVDEGAASINSIDNASTGACSPRLPD